MAATTKKQKHKRSILSRQLLPFFALGRTEYGSWFTAREAHTSSSQLNTRNKPWLTTCVTSHQQKTLRRCPQPGAGIGVTRWARAARRRVPCLAGLPAQLWTDVAAGVAARGGRRRGRGRTLTSGSWRCGGWRNCGCFARSGEPVSAHLEPGGSWPRFHCRCHRTWGLRSCCSWIHCFLQVERIKKNGNNQMQQWNNAFNLIRIIKSRSFPFAR